MGCDGGTIPRRDELVRMKKKPEQKDKDSELRYKYQFCTIKQLPLQQPIVACSKGRLYSKESVIEGLLDRSILPECAQHIRNLKDVKTLTFTPNPAFDANATEKGDTNISNNRSPFICPVTGLEMSGKFKFCFLWTCGCVLSERSLKEVKSETCHKCQQSFLETDIVVLNPEEDDIALMEERAIIRKAAMKKLKKKKIEVEEGESSSKSEPPKKKIKKEIKTNAIIDNRRTKNDQPQKPIASDPNASEVYKSIFVTHESAKSQEKAHWVTYNPFYN